MLVRGETWRKGIETSSERTAEDASLVTEDKVVLEISVSVASSTSVSMGFVFVLLTQVA